MKIPETDPNENERLKELDSYNIIGEMEHADYDFLTHLASKICDTKISLLSLITDKKQWFLSHHGLDVKEIEKDFTICAHTINSKEEIFIVEDTRKDIRFHDNPLITENSSVIFYAGVPLINEAGFALGTLCVIDDHPRTLSKDQKETLKSLSRQFIKLLELKRKSKELDRLNLMLTKKTLLFNESQRINKTGAWVLDVLTGKTEWTEEVYAIYDVDLDFDHNKENGINYYHHEDQNVIISAIENTISTKLPFDVICRFISHKGIHKWVRATGIYWQENKTSPKLIGSFQDVTKIKRETEELEDALSKNQAIFNASTKVSIITTDLFGIITSFNNGAELQLGYSADEMILKQSIQALHLKKEIHNFENDVLIENNKDIKGFNAFVSNIKASLNKTKEWTYLRKDGSNYPVLLSLTTLKQKEKNTGFLAVGVDISDIKKAEKEVQTLLNLTNDKNERLKDFAHIVSHNLRSHSGGISMLIDFFKEENPEINKNELFQHIKKASDNLSETIQHLTDVVQINTSTRENTVPINLSKTIERNISSLLPLAINKGVVLQNEVPDHIKVLAVPAYLESIILNLLSNGIKYSSNERNSYVKVYTEITDEFIILFFEDNGLGIDLSRHRKKLFGIYKTFHKHEDSRGVGLFITKNHIEAMGGKIEVESKINVGTTFKIHINYEKN